MGPISMTPMPLTGLRSTMGVRQGRFAAAWRRALAACGLFEWLTFAYLVFLNGMLLLFGASLPARWGFFLLHMAIAAGILILAGTAAIVSNPLVRFARHWYPLALFLFFFEELHYLVHMVFPGWFDPLLIQFDFALFGVHPTVWIEQFATPARNDAMQFAYMTYYLYTVIVGGLLLRKGETSAFWQVMSATALGYYAGYIVSILFPIEGPYHTLAAVQRVELHGGAVTAMIDFIERFGRVHGAAFPSAHVSGATVAVLGAWKFRRGLFWSFLPFYLAMLVATVYGRYHYVADVLAGLLVAWFAFRLVTSKLARS